jgi:regulator of protease activity HflC (stomatin/prohibitin superfamily)
MRPVEFGTLHEIKVASSAPDADALIPAEAIPPASTNHVWDTTVPTEAEYLVASQSQGGAQGFQAVDAEIHVVYRIGLTDADAMQSVYGSETDPATLVSEASSHVVSLYFASHTLEMVMGAQRDALAESLRASLARDIAAYHAGIEIVSVHIESVHPPAGAAAAYHQVQAAEINANASIFNETARARRMAGVADQEAHELVTAAQASSDEKVDAAKADAYQFNADRKAYAEGQNSFVMERTFAALVAALRQVRLTIVDNRLTPAQAPIIDMRSGAAPAAPDASPAAPATSGAPTTPAAPATPAANPPAAPPPASLTPGAEVPN